MKKQIIVTMLLAAALGTVSPSMKAEAKWKADAKGRWYTIKAAPGYGFARTQQTMRKLHISESRRLRGLGANQRAALVELFGGAR